MAAEQRAERAHGSLGARAIDWVFGHDYFISYSHGDGKHYPRALKERLERAGFRVFLDQTDYAGGTNLARETRRQVGKCDVMVVVGRARALTSVWVRREIEIALAHGKDPVVIDVNGALARAPAGEGIVDTVRAEHWLRINEQIADARGRPVADGEPSEATVAELVRSFRHTRQQTKRARMLAAVAGVLAVAAVYAWWQKGVATAALGVAQKQEKVAQAEAARAEIRNLVLLARRAETLAADGDATAAGLVALEALQGLARHADHADAPAARDEAMRALHSGFHGRRELAVLRGAEPADREAISVAISPSSRRIAVGRASGAIEVHSVAGARIAAIPRPPTAKRINGLAFSPDGSRLLSWSQDGTARQWSPETGAPVGAVMAHEGPVLAAAYDASGMRIVTASEDRTARVWRGEDGSPLHDPARHGGKVNDARFSPDGQWIVTAAEDGKARLWRTADGGLARELPGHTRGVRSAEFSPDGTRIATAGADWEARIWRHPGEGSLPLKGHGDTVFGARFSPDGKRLLTYSEDFSARLWNVETGGLEARFTHGSWVVSGAFSPDGDRILTASNDNRARIWSATTGDLLADFAGHDTTERYWLRAAYASSGDFIATASWDGTARLWRVAGGAELMVIEPGRGDVLSAAFSHDGALVATGAAGSETEGFLDVWRSDTGERAHPRVATPGRLWGMAFHPFRPVVAAAAGSGRQIVRLDLESGRVEFGLHDDTPGRADNRAMRAVAFSRDGTKLASGGRDGLARIWDAATLTRIAGPFHHGDEIQALALDRGGERLVTAGLNGRVRVWDVAGGGHRELRRDAHRVYTARLARDGTRLFVSSAGGHVGFWGLAGESRFDPVHEVRGEAWGAAMSADETLVAAADHSRRPAAVIKEIASRREIAVLRGHTGGIRTVSFSPDGRRVLTAGDDDTARIWPIFRDPAELMARFARTTPRCLAPAERIRLGLGAAPPAWCITGFGNEGETDSTLWRPKWPYDGPAWQAWQRARRAGEPDPPRPKE
jgi:WD40 repeat protein